MAANNQAAYYPPPNSPPLRATTASPPYAASEAPSYRTNDPFNPMPVPGAAYQPRPAVVAPPPARSPFDSPFDDPGLNPHQDSASDSNPFHRRDSLYSPSLMSSTTAGNNIRPSEARRYDDMYQPAYIPNDPHGRDARGLNTEYYGAAGPSPSLGPPSPDDRQPTMGDDIPLQNRPGKDLEMDDHIYDAPQGAAGGAAGGGRPPGNSAKARLRYGDLGGMFKQDKNRIPWMVYLLTLVQVGVFIGELVKQGVLTGSPIQTRPTFNYMIGPSAPVLINMGARYVACMHNVDVIQNSTQTINWQCPNSVTTESKCTLSELCGFGGVPEPLYNGNPNQTPEPNQWWRFIIPIFMHAGLLHIGFNLFLQMTIGKMVEQLIGPVRFFLVYMSAGIFGFVFGGNFAGTGVASTGASGALFGIMALVLLDLLYSWRTRRNPGRELAFLLAEIVITIFLGLLIPFVDNFSHIGGFIVGLCVGISILHSPDVLRERIGSSSSYSDMQTSNVFSSAGNNPPFYKNPVGFFKGRKPLWWAWWLLRAGAMVLVVVTFIVLLNSFYSGQNHCGWCKYLNCVIVRDWCDATDIKIQPDTSENPARLLKLL